MKAIPTKFKGVEYESIRAACKALGLDYNMVHMRVNKCGWSIDKALSAPAREKGNYLDHFGETFGRLQIMDFEEHQNGRARALCRCSCDNLTLVVVYLRHLLSGNTTSCGCAHKKLVRSLRGKQVGSFRHGKTNSKIYKVWASIKQRVKREGCPLEPGWTDFMNFDKDAISDGYSDVNKSPHRKIKANSYVRSNIIWMSVKDHSAIHSFKKMGAPKGKRPSTAKFTNKQIRSIREQYKDGDSQIKLAKEFGVGKANISRIVNKHLYKDVSVMMPSLY